MTFRQVDVSRISLLLRVASPTNPTPSSDSHSCTECSFRPVFTMVLCHGTIFLSLAIIKFLDLLNPMGSNLQPAAQQTNTALQAQVLLKLWTLEIVPQGKSCRDGAMRVGVKGAPSAVLTLSISAPVIPVIRGLYAPARLRASKDLFSGALRCKMLKILIHCVWKAGNKIVQ